MDKFHVWVLEITPWWCLPFYVHGFHLFSSLSFFLSISLLHFSYFPSLSLSISFLLIPFFSGVSKRAGKRGDTTGERLVSRPIEFRDLFRAFDAHVHKVLAPSIDPSLAHIFSFLVPWYIQWWSKVRRGGKVLGTRSLRKTSSSQLELIEGDQIL